MINYIDQYALITSRRLDYLDFRICHEMMVAKIHLTDQSCECILSLV